ncbi:hypothetical protein ACI65C_004590 [Semiaphis heraclei]
MSAIATVRRVVAAADSRARGSKRQRRESTNLKNYVVMSSTSAENNHQSDNTSTTTLEPKEYWKTHAFYPNLFEVIPNDLQCEMTVLKNMIKEFLAI